jgi:hypothetical protein
MELLYGIAVVSVYVKIMYNKIECNFYNYNTIKLFININTIVLTLLQIC